jgi:ketosteroid isomerase-like protein
MSENSTPVHLVRRFGDALASRDFNAAGECFAPDAVYDASRAGIGTFAGRAAIRSFLRDWLAAYEEWQNEWEEIQELADGVFFSVNLQTGRPAGSHGRVQERYALTFSAGVTGLLTRVEISQNVDEARVGAERLAEQRG